RRARPSAVGLRVGRPLDGDKRAGFLPILRNCISMPPNRGQSPPTPSLSFGSRPCAILWRTGAKYSRGLRCFLRRNTGVLNSQVFIQRVAGGLSVWRVNLELAAIRCRYLELWHQRGLTVLPLGILTPPPGRASYCSGVWRKLD